MRTLLQVFVAGAVAFSVFALLLRVWGVGLGNGAVAGRLGAEASFLSDYHPNNIALYLALALAFVPAIAAETLRGVRLDVARNVYSAIRTSAPFACGTLVMLVVLWRTYSRGALLALCLGGLSALVILPISGWRLPRRMVIVVLGVLVIGLGVFLLAGGADTLGRYATLLNPFDLSTDPDVAFRLDLYSRALQVVSSHPITGIGLQQFATTGDVPFSPHNTYLDIWVSTGAYGMLAYIAILLIGLSRACLSAYRLSKSRSLLEMLYSLGFVIALTAFVIQGFIEAYDATTRIATITLMLALSADTTLRTVRSFRRQGIEESAPTGAEADEPGQNGHTAPQPADEAGQQQASFAGSHQSAIHDTVIAVPDTQATGIALADAAQQPDRMEHPSEIVSQTEDGATLSGGGTITASDHHLSTPESKNDVGEALLKRAPTSFLWNQMYALWFFGTNFLLSIVITRGLTPNDYGIFATLTTIIGTITFIVALGLEDTATVFLPRVLTKDGSAATGTLIRRLLLGRVMVVGVVGISLTIALLVATPLLVHLGVSPQLFGGSSHNAEALRAIVVCLYLAGNSITTLQSAFFAALLRSRAVLVIGGLSQAACVVAVFILLRIGWGIDGVFIALALVNWLTVIAFLGPLRQLLFARGTISSIHKGEIPKLMTGAWLTNITNGALGKQMDIIIMTAFAVSYAEIGYYNLAYQLGSIIGVLLISGLGGVGLAAMSAALSTGGRGRLASMWRANIMLQTILATPLQIISFVFADQIVVVLFGPDYIGAGLLLRIYLGFTIFGRLTGGGSSQSALYVLGRQRSVVATRWSGLVINLALDIVLIRLYGPIGAIIATGFTQVAVGFTELLLLRRNLHMVYPVAYTWRMTSVAIFAALLLTWWSPPGFVGLVAEFTVFAVLFIFGLWILRSGEPAARNDLTEMMIANPRLEALITGIGKRLPHRKSAAVVTP